MSDPGRILVWFSCGAASAVAAKVAVERYGSERAVEVCYCAGTEHDEHPDNARFLSDVERWIGRPVKKLYHHKYNTVEEVWRGERFIAGVRGAACTKHLKRQVMNTYARPEDVRILGFTADEKQRATDLEARFPDERFEWVLIPGGITKADCYRIIQAAGIELPAMYRLGFNNNNCIGCCKGGKGYWNKVRRHFPEVFVRRAKVEREIGFPILRDVWLDELDPDAGRAVPEPSIDCGVFCDHYSNLVALTAAGVRA